MQINDNNVIFMSAKYSYSFEHTLVRGAFFFRYIEKVVSFIKKTCSFDRINAPRATLTDKNMFNSHVSQLGFM